MTSLNKTLMDSRVFLKELFLVSIPSWTGGSGLRLEFKDLVVTAESML